MQKLSVLIFSKDDPHKALKLIKDMYSVADEIVLVDSSNKGNRAFLERTKRREKLNKLKIFYVLPLGYPDPFRMYAIKKCRNSWILLIDTDERLSLQFMKGIREMITESKASAFAIRRYEEVHNEKKIPRFFTWQIRLFRKNKVHFTGMPHEQPAIKGPLHKVTEKSYYMMHLSLLMSRTTTLEYKKIEQFERLTYELFNIKILDYFSKVAMPQGRSISELPSGKFISGFLDAYQKLTLKQKHQELSNFDYFVYHTLLELAYHIQERNLHGMPHIIPAQLRYIEKVRQWKKSAEGKEVLEISKILNTTGLTKFLSLDSEKAVAALNHKYEGKKAGADLLIDLIVEKYHRVKGKR